jgi:hypothetical protein
MIRLLTRNVDIGDFFTYEKSQNLSCFRLPAEIFCWLIQQSRCPDPNLSLHKRVEIILNLGYSQIDFASLAREILGGVPISSSLCKIKHNTDHRSGVTLLHYTAEQLGNHYFWWPRHFWRYLNADQKAVKELYSDETQQDHDGLCRLLMLLKDLVTGGSDLHALIRWGYRGWATPLTGMLHWFDVVRHYAQISRAQWGFWWSPDDVPLSQPRCKLPTPVRAWLELLQNTGVDLTEYGEKEKHLHDIGRVNKLFIDTEYQVRLISFTYGPSPDDWEFCFVELDDYFADFWYMVDHPEAGMPGAWDEIYDDNDYFRHDNADPVELHDSDSD